MSPLRPVALLILVVALPIQAVAQVEPVAAQDNAAPDLDQQIKEWLGDDETPYPVESMDDDETRLLKQRVNIMYVEMKTHRRMLHHGVHPVRFLIDSRKRLMTAELDLLVEPDEIITARERHLQLARELETQMRAGFEEGLRPPSDLTEAIDFSAGHGTAAVTRQKGRS